MDDQQRRQRLADIAPLALGMRLKSGRIAAGLTQHQVCSGHASVSFLSRIESGKRRPDLTLLVALAGRLEVDVDDLLSGDSTHPQGADPTLDFAEIALRMGDADAALEQVAQLDLAALSETDRCRVMLVQAQAREARGDLHGAIDILEPLADRVGNEFTRARIGMSLSHCFRELGEYGRAIASGEAALARLGTLGLEAADESIQLAVTVAAAYFESGEREHALRLCRRSVAMAEDLGSPVARASAYWNAAVIAVEQHEADEAVALGQRALALLSEGSDERSRGFLRTQLGLMQLRLDPPAVDAAWDDLTAAVETMRLTDATRTSVLWARFGLARCQVLRGEFSLAEESLRYLLEETAGIPLLKADVLTVLAQSARSQGDLDSARSTLTTCVHTMLAVGNLRAAGERWFEIASLSEAIGDSKLAAEAYRAAAVCGGVQSRFAVFAAPTTAPHEGAAASVADIVAAPTV